MTKRGCGSIQRESRQRAASQAEVEATLYDRLNILRKLKPLRRCLILSISTLNSVR